MWGDPEPQNDGEPAAFVQLLPYTGGDLYDLGDKARSPVLKLNGAERSRLKALVSEASRERAERNRRVEDQIEKYADPDFRPNVEIRHAHTVNGKPHAQRLHEIRTRVPDPVYQLLSPNLREDSEMSRAAAAPFVPPGDLEDWPVRCKHVGCNNPVATHKGAGGYCVDPQFEPTHRRIWLDHTKITQNGPKKKKEEVKKGTAEKQPATKRRSSIIVGEPQHEIVFLPKDVEARTQVEPMGGQEHGDKWEAINDQITTVRALEQDLEIAKHELRELVQQA